jgi:hypothetical protein
MQSIYNRTLSLQRNLICLMFNSSSNHNRTSVSIGSQYGRLWFKIIDYLSKENYSRTANKAKKSTQDNATGERYIIHIKVESFTLMSNSSHFLHRCLKKKPPRGS